MHFNGSLIGVLFYCFLLLENWYSEVFQYSEHFCHHIRSPHHQMYALLILYLLSVINTISQHCNVDVDSVVQ